MLKINQNESFSFNFKELKLTTKFLKNKKKEFLINTNKIHIPQKKIKKCIQKYHNLLEFRHLGITNIMDIIKRNCHFNNIKKYIQKYIMQCTQCQRNKHSTQKKLSYPQLLEYLIKL